MLDLVLKVLKVTRDFGLLCLSLSVAVVTLCSVLWE